MGWFWDIQSHLSVWLGRGNHHKFEVQVGRLVIWIR